MKVQVKKGKSLEKRCFGKESVYTANTTGPDSVCCNWLFNHPLTAASLKWKVGAWDPASPQIEYRPHSWQIPATQPPHSRHPSTLVRSVE